MVIIFLIICYFNNLYVYNTHILLNLNVRFILCHLKPLLWQLSTYCVLFTHATSLTVYYNRSIWRDTIMFYS